MTTALVDTSASSLQILYDQVCRYCHEQNIFMHIRQFTSEGALLTSMHSTAYSLVFLDISPDIPSALYTARQITKQSPGCQIIFTSSTTAHAAAAFRLHALDYLVKPFPYAHLKDALDRFSFIGNEFVHYIKLKEGRSYTRVPVSSILYTGRHNHYVEIYTPSCVIRSHLTFAELEEMLKPYPQFLWCCRNCLVNMDHILSFDNCHFTLRNGKKLHMTKSGRSHIIQT